jgi:5-oxoprolinase (ATP-hydrolysing) subunit A
MSQFVDINVDLGESYGRWSLGDDLGIMPYISSANIACGYHAGDPLTMRKTVRAAIEHGLQIGAHVALPDLLGFGRRQMSVTPAELKEYVIYQVGALRVCQGRRR